ncbi:MAG: type IV toxin-antitoxin system AbiEi family antitoxin domain-containing protein [Nanoarchaeota archaeon]
MNLSKLENKTYEIMKESNLVVFKVSDIEKLLEVNKQKAYNIIKSLKKKGAIISVGKGKFTLYGTNEFEIASELNFPSYISFWTALNYYGFSDNTPKKIFIATTKYSKEIKNFKFVTLSKKKFFGYTSIGKITIAEKEKSIIDSLLFPKYSGGIKEIKTSLEKAVEEIEIKKLIDFAIKTDSKAVIRRLGFLLEKLKIKYPKKIEKLIGKGYELLDPSLEKKNNLNKKWLLDINI